MMDPFEKIEEGVDFVEAINTPILGGIVVNIAYLLILRKGWMEKSCEQWDDMHVGLKTWQSLKDHFSQSYRRYQIHNKAKSGGPWVWGVIKFIHKKQMPNSTLQMRFKHSHLYQWKTRRQWQTSPAST